MDANLAVSPRENSAIATVAPPISLTEIFELQRDPLVAYLTSLSPSSQKTMRKNLDRLAKVVSNDQMDASAFPWATLRFQQTQAIRAVLSAKYQEQKYAGATVNGMLRAMRGVLKAAWRLDLMDSESYRRAVDIPDIKYEALLAGREIPVAEVEEAAENCWKDSRPSGARDAAVIMVAQSGLRREEIINLDLGSIDLLTGEIKVLRGKGNKDRITYLPPDGLQCLQDWIAVRGQEPGPFFTRCYKSIVTLKRLGTSSVNAIFERRKGATTQGKLAPHDFRRTFITQLYRAEVDGATIQKLAGHTNYATTIRYDRRGEEAKLEAVRRLRVPTKRLELVEV